MYSYSNKSIESKPAPCKYRNVTSDHTLQSSTYYVTDYTVSQYLARFILKIFHKLSNHFRKSEFL